jgi:formylglycine-generating enzyme required for sulfatase activity
MEYPRGDVNYDGQVSIKDVTCLIDYLLNGTWEDEPVNPDEPQTETFTVNGVSFTMVAVEGGTFTMGATAEQGNSAQDNEKPAHEVIISSFCIGETEVTQELWQAVMGSNPSSFTGDPQRPVEMVSWINCKTFINRLNQLTGKTFRLPTEAEWEFAARGGNQSQGYIYSGSNTIGDVAWYYQNSSYTTHPVATKAPNELGLYDMSGNVTEWCQDWYGSYSSDAQTNPVGPSTGYSRVHRGGIYASACRVSYRSYFSPTNTSDFCGLRLAFDPDNGSTPEEHEYVDLGLPSGTLWATCNVGANVPEDYGDYFAWGETEPKNYYNFSTYKWCNGSVKTMTKYCIQTDYGNNGFTDGKTELDPEDDAAYVNWGPEWRMPTVDQQQELVDNCTWTWTTQNGVKGGLVVGPNGNFLFLPAARCYTGGSLWNSVAGDYWSRTLTSDYSCSAHELVVYPSDAFGIIFHTQMLNRDYGLTVRAVRVQQD